MPISALRLKFVALAVSTAVAVAAALAIGSVASRAASSDAPVSVAPANGQKVHHGVPFAFKVRSHGGAGVFVKVSRSKHVGADGTLASDDEYFRSLALRGGLYSHKVERYPALTDYFLNRPGRYYWQAYKIDCANSPDADSGDCNIEGPIRSFTVR
jgi:hypothetical protein